MVQPPQETEFNFSLYVFSEDDEACKELVARPINKEVLMKAMVDLKLEGQWRVHQTACGLLISFMREDDLCTFQSLDLSSILGLPALSYCFSSLDTYRQRVLIKDVPWMLSRREIEAALMRQGIIALEFIRTHNGNIILELGDPMQFNKLLQDGFDFYNSARFAVTPLPRMTPPPPPVHRVNFAMRDNTLQCFKCQGFWHYAAQCPNVQRCVRCGDPHPVSDCPRPRNDPICVHCSGPHHAAYKNCPIRLQAKTISAMPTSFFVPAFMPPYTRPSIL